MPRLSVVSTFNPSGINQAMREMRKLESVAKKSGNATAAGMFAASQKMAGVGSSAQAMGSSLTTGLTLPLAAVGAGAFMVGSKYETSMNQVQAASGATAQEMAKLDQQARNMGVGIGIGANEASQAILELAKSGMTPAQIEAGGLRAALDLAAAGGISMETAAQVASNALNTFGLEAKDAAAVSDALAGGANASSASVDSLQQALAQAGAGAVNAGLSLNETVGVLAAFADNGIQGSDAGTSLKTMLSRLVPQTSQAKDAMKALGLSFVDSKGNIDNVSTVAQKLQDKLGGLSQEQRVTALQTMFGSDATRAATVLMREGAKGLEGYIKATNDKTAAEKMAEAATKGGEGSIKKMKASLESAGIAASKAFAPAVSDIADAVKGLSDKFSQLDPKQQDMVVKFGLVAAAAGPALMIFGKMAAGLGSIMKFAGMVSIAMKGEAAATAVSTGAKMAAAGATKIMAAAQWVLNAAMTANPIGLVVVAIAALVAAFVIAYKKSETFRNIVNKTWEAIKNGAKALWNTVVGIFKKFGPAILVAVAPIVGVAAFIVKNWDKIKDGAVKAFTSVVNWVKGVPGKIKAGLGNLGNLLKDAGQAIITGLWDGLKAMWEKVKGWVTGIGDWIKQNKGPISYDKKLLVDNGIAIMSGLSTGLSTGWAGVQRQVAGYTTAFGGSFDGTFGVARSGAGGGITININAPGATSETVSGLQAVGNDIVSALTRELGL